MMESSLSESLAGPERLRPGTHKAHHVLINPASAGGKTKDKVGPILFALQERFGRDLSWELTRGPGEATNLARRAILDGSLLLIVVGGDGTLQEAVNGFFARGKPINPACQLGIINCGTGHGFHQSLGLPSPLEDQLDILVHGQPRFVDVGSAIYVDELGSFRQRIFLNEFQVGIGPAVVLGVRSGRKRLGGSLAFGSVALSKALSQQALLLDIEVDGCQRITRPLIGAVVANGRYTAGGMRLAPKAAPEDGLLDVLLMHDQSLWRRLQNFAKVYSGRHIDEPEFTYIRGRRVRMSGPVPALVEADGEILGRLPCFIEVLPAALEVRAGFGPGRLPS